MIVARLERRVGPPTVDPATKSGDKSSHSKRRFDLTSALRSGMLGALPPDVSLSRSHPPSALARPTYSTTKETLTMRPRTHSLHGTKRGRFLISLVAAAGAVLSLGVFSAGAAAEDWPTYQHDAARSGVTSDPVKPPLTPCWVFQPRDKPQPAWGDPKPEPVEDVLELRRAHFDDVFHVVVADGAVFFGSSANGKVYCLDAATGKIRWTALDRRPRAARADGRRRPRVRRVGRRPRLLPRRQGRIDRLEAPRLARRSLGARQRKDDLAVSGANRRAGRRRHGLLRRRHLPDRRRVPPRGGRPRRQAPLATGLFLRARPGEHVRFSPGLPAGLGVDALRADGSGVAGGVRPARRTHEIREFLRQDHRRHLCPAGRQARLHRNRGDAGLRSGNRATASPRLPDGR